MAVAAAASAAAGYPNAATMMQQAAQAQLLQQARRSYEYAGYDRNSAVYDPYAAAANAAAAYEAALYGTDVAGVSRRHYGQALPGTAGCGGSGEGVEFLQSLFPNTRISVKQVAQASAGMPRPLASPYGAGAMQGGIPGSAYAAASANLYGAANLGPHNPLLNHAAVAAAAGSGNLGAFNAAAAAAAVNTAAAMQHQQQLLAAAAASGPSGMLHPNYMDGQCGAGKGSRGFGTDSHAGGMNGAGNRRRRGGNAV